MRFLFRQLIQYIFFGSTMTILPLAMGLMAGASLIDGLGGKTKVKQYSLLNKDQQGLLRTGTEAIGTALPGAVNTISDRMNNGQSTFDSMGTANVLNAMKRNNLATASRARAVNNQSLQRTSLGRNAANAMLAEGLARNDLNADQYGLEAQSRAEEAARQRELGYSGALGSMYGASIGNTMENAAQTQGGLSRGFGKLFGK